MEENFNVELNRDEAKELCLVLRKNQSLNSKFLNDLENRIEKYLFDTMTIDEAENLFNED